MADNKSTLNKPNAAGEVLTDLSNVLCRFKFDGQQFFVVKLVEEARLSDRLSDNHPDSLMEICRFQLDGCPYAIVVTKVVIDKSNELDLSVVLNNRELQIATLVALGCPNKQISDKLHISEWTVASYLRKIFAKLHVDTRAAMIYRCASLIGKQDLMAKQDIP